MVDAHSTPDESPVPMKTCTKCGETKPITEFWFHRTKTNPQARRSRCKPCEAADHAAYVAAHREDLNTYCRERRRGNAKHLQVKRAWTDKNREKVNAQWRARWPVYAADTPRQQAKRRRYNAAHPDKIAHAHRTWQQKNKAHYLSLIARRAARKRGASVSDLSAAQWEEIKAAYDHRCVYCGRQMHRLTQDHILPLSQGGNHTFSNVVPACQSCNSKKHTSPPLRPVQPLLLTLAKPLKKRKSKK